MSLRKPTSSGGKEGCVRRLPPKVACLDIAAQLLSPFNVQMQGGVVTTVHNHLTYDVLGLQSGVKLDDKMPEMRSKVIAKRNKAEGKEDDAEEPVLSFREYFK